MTTEWRAMALTAATHNHESHTLHGAECLGGTVKRRITVPAPTGGRKRRKEKKRRVAVDVDECMFIGLDSFVWICLPELKGTKYVSRRPR